MTMDDWANPGARSVAIYLDGRDAPDRADDGKPLIDDDFLVLVNAWWEPLDFTLPATREWQQCWSTEIDTFQPTIAAPSADLPTGETRKLGPRSVVVLRAASSPP
jgi:glycogen operon protein